TSAIIEGPRRLGIEAKSVNKARSRTNGALKSDAKLKFRICIARCVIRCRLTFAFCRTACAVQRAGGVGQQRAVRRLHPHTNRGTKMAARSNMSKPKAKRMRARGVTCGEARPVGSANGRK